MTSAEIVQQYSDAQCRHIVENIVLALYCNHRGEWDYEKTWDTGVLDLIAEVFETLNLPYEDGVE